METTQEKQGTIYVENAGQQIANPVSSEAGVDLKKIYTTVPEDKGRVADVGTAQELAKTEDALGQSARVAQENRMEFVANEGMTEIQKRNSELMDGIEQKHPDACFKTVDEKGRKFLVANTEDKASIWSGRSLIFTKDGAFLLDNTNIGGKDNFTNNVDWNKMGDFLEESLQDENRTWNLNYKNEISARLWSGHFCKPQAEIKAISREPVTVDAVMLNIDDSIGGIKQILEISEEINKEKKARETQPAPKSAAELLSSL